MLTQYFAHKNADPSVQPSRINIAKDAKPLPANETKEKEKEKEQPEK
jgi:hypothetical protein